MTKDKRQYLRSVRNIEVDEFDLLVGDIIGIACIDDLSKQVILSLSTEGARVENDVYGEYAPGTVKPLRYFLDQTYSDEADREVTKLGTVETHEVIDGEVVER